MDDPYYAERPGGSSWGRRPPPRPKLRESRVADVAIVGGGVTGLLLGALLTRRGLSTVVLEASHVASGGLGTGHVVAWPTNGFAEVVSRAGAPRARWLWQAASQGLDRIEGLVREERIRCGFERVPLHLFTGQAPAAGLLRQEVELARQLGVPVIPGDPSALPMASQLSFDVPAQAQVDPVALALGLAGAMERLGGEVYEESRVIGVEYGYPSRVTTDEGDVRARHVVIATHAPGSLIQGVQARLRGERVYSVAARMEGDAPPAAGLFWTPGPPAMRLRSFGDQIIAAGWRHPGHEPVDPARWADLAALVSTWFHYVTVTHRWSGLTWWSADGLPFAGPIPGRPHLWVISGLGQNGLTYGAAGALLVAAKLTGRPCPWEPAFDPDRPAYAFRDRAGVRSTMGAPRLPGGWE